jgi:RNA polymerase sigma factor (sigma-70 family)
MRYPEHRKLSDEEVAAIWYRGYVQGDEPSRHLLLNNYINYILKRFSRYPDDKYDMLHDTIIYLSKRLQDFDPKKGSIVTFITWATRHIISSRAVALKRGNCINDEKFPQPEKSTEPEIWEVCRKADIKEDRKKILNAIKKLDPKFGEVIKMRYFDNMTLEQVSQRLGIVREAVRLRQITALKRLKQYL